MIWAYADLMMLLVVDKNGDVETLTFPTFHQELLTQNYWNAGDNLGRIKVIISEGFPRDSATMPFERVKNLVAFSFQHAPLGTQLFLDLPREIIYLFENCSDFTIPDVLEASSIAWPNASMWRQVSFAASIMPGASIQRNASESGIEVHSHSPRRSSATLVRQQLPPYAMGMMPPPVLPSYLRAANYDPFTEPRPALWRQPSSTDVSMPDYSSSVSQASHSRQFTDPVVADRPERRYQSLQSVGAFEGLCEALMPVREAQKADAQEVGDVIIVQNRTAPSRDDHSAGKFGMFSLNDFAHTK